jgi:L-malate glycosyltransferase
MRIIFDLRNTGLGNQGGSATLVNSANTLVELGHEVYVVDSMKNQHTWTPLLAKHMIDRLPNADVIIATGYQSVRATVKAPTRCGVKFHYIRAWETWQMPEQAIVKNILQQPTIKIVNGIGLQKKLKSYNIDSKIIRPGYDFEDFYPQPKKNNSTIILGGVYRMGKFGYIKRTDWIFEATSIIKKKIKNVELWMFGTESNPKNSVVDKYFRSPSKEDKQCFYNMIDIFLAPTQQEGLHIPPAEAMLTETAVVGTNAELSGMQDYLIHEKTGLVSDNNTQSFSTNVERLVINENFRKKLGIHGRMKIIEIGDRKTNMKKMVEFFGEYL